MNERAWASRRENAEWVEQFMPEALTIIRRVIPNAYKQRGVWHIPIIGLAT